MSASDIAPDDPHTARLRAVANQAAATVTDEHVRCARRAYYGNVTYVDEWTGRLIESLSALGLTDDTVVVLLADHGDLLGERGLWYKMSFFEGSARVPLVLHAPRRFAPRRVAEPVSLVDVLPTLTDLAGLDVEPVDPLAGSSLVPLCDAVSEPRTVIGEYMAEGSVAPIVMIRRDHLKFVHCPVDPDQLYDLDRDPDELHNLAPLPECAATVAAFRDEVATRWDLDALAEQVLHSQARRRLITTALRTGAFTAWDHSPRRDAANEYMRNHLDLNQVERATRWPRSG